MLPSIREGQTLREEVPSRAPSAVTDPASGVISLICIGRMFARNNEWRRYGRFRRSSFVWRMRTRFPQHSIIVGPIPPTKATCPGPNAAPETAHSFIPQIEPGKGGFLPPGCGTCRRVGVSRTSIERVLSFPQDLGCRVTSMYELRGYAKCAA